MSQPLTDPITGARSAFSYPQRNEAGVSAVSWAAVAAGAFVAAALALILLALGAGAGLSSLSPWSTSGVTPGAVGTGALVWLVIVELIASAIGGYLAGRLRTKWVDVHSHEVYFRDTAHGFLSWAVAFVVTAGFLTSAASTMVGGEARAMNAGGGQAAAVDPNRYYIDRLFRIEGTAPTLDPTVRAEASGIFTHALRERALAPDDKAYLAGILTARSNIAATDAGQRVDQAFGQEQEALDVARKAAAHALYWLFVALLVGAFAASWSATIGGRRRDLAHLA
ncbi:MAG TPA: hypothetical protein VGM77_10195 [Gemmatimonadales bacterium]|jgi:hypothetical protein